MAINLKVAALVSIIGLTGAGSWTAVSAIHSGDKANTQEVEALRKEIKVDILSIDTKLDNQGQILAAQTEILKDIKEEIKDLER